METIRDVRLRLKSIQNTKQITESMRLISTRKVQRVRLRMADNMPYLEQSALIIKDLLTEADFGRHRYFAGRGTGEPLLILITGDRGLCGGYNTNAAKEGYALARRLDGAQTISVGTKGRDYLRRRQQPIKQSVRGLSENPFHEDARSIGDMALSMYDEGAANEVYLVYTEYISMLTQAPKTVRLLPVDLGGKDEANAGVDGDTSGNGSAGGGDAAPAERVRLDSGIRWLSDAEAYIRYAVSAYVSSVIFGAMLESAVCEQCARVMSMDSAVKNAEKMIAALTLRFNEMRQGAITQEIAEVIGGANVVGQD